MGGVYRVLQRPSEIYDETMFITVATELEDEAIRTISAQHTALVASTSWTLRDGGQSDPRGEELENVLANNPISTDDADVMPDAWNQNDRSAMPQNTDGSCGIADRTSRDTARTIRIGRDGHERRLI